MLRPLARRLHPVLRQRARRGRFRMPAPRRGGGHGRLVVHLPVRHGMVHIMPARLSHHVDQGALPDGVRAPGARPRGAVGDGKNNVGCREPPTEIIRSGKFRRDGRYLNAAARVQQHISFHEW